jgi:hypothetical protein
VDNSPANNLYVEFYEDALEIPFRSEQEGRPVYEQREFVRIMVPGDSTNIIEVPVTQGHKEQFPKQYARFKEGLKDVVEGTPLKMWPVINRSQVKEAEYFEVRSVEQLAELSDNICKRMGMGYMELRGKARAWLLSAKDSSVVTRQAAENDRLQAEIELLKTQIAELATPKRGRPAKEVAEA